jgi:hypothetical protein
MESSSSLFASLWGNPTLLYSTSSSSSSQFTNNSAPLFLILASPTNFPIEPFLNSRIR